MKSRMNINNVEPLIYEAMSESDTRIDAFDLDPKLKELVRLRASQINGCGFCINYHTQNALKLGETAQRLFAVSAWWETPFFSEEERAVLKLTEEVTNIFYHGVLDEVYNNVLKILGEKKLIQLIFIIVTINSWNRLAISTHMVAEND
jgi:AhpD family alkylhydroperoxidase